MGSSAKDVVLEDPIAEEQIHASFLRRAEVLLACQADERLQEIQRILCAEDCVHFFNHYAVTYDPRVVSRKLPAYLPFDLFPRQVELVRWLDARVEAGEEGLLEKSRDIGWTWVAAGYALNKWLFQPGFRTTFGSRKVDLVDKLGDPDSILEKVRLMVDRLPPWMLPKGWRKEAHANHCKIMNPENGNVIGGEGGSEMGRGGRATLYLLDEFAYVDHADSVAAAVLANSDVRIYASSVNGPGDLFAKKRHGGVLRPDQIFTFNWRDDPRKTNEWAQRKRAELAATPWMFAREYDIDYSAAVEGLCIPAAWVNAALKLGQLVDLPDRRLAGQKVAGLDVGDSCARSVLQPRFDSVLTPPQSWGLPDTTQTALNALEAAEALGVELINYDTIGVGKGVSATLKNNVAVSLVTDLLNPRRYSVKVHPVNVGDAPDWRTVWPDGQSSRVKFHNLKIELWWKARERFKCAAEHLRFLTGEEIADVESKEHDLSEVFVFEPAPQHVYRETIVQLSTPKRLFRDNGKLILESKKQLADRGVSSPDYADAVVLSLAVPSESEVRAVAPIVAARQVAYPELQTGVTPGVRSVNSGSGSPVVGGGHKPAVPTGKRFDADFARDW